MKRLAPKLARIAAVATAKTESFVALARLANLDPARAFVGADLRNVDFGTGDIAGFNFRGARLEGANLSNTKNSEFAIFDTATSDTATRWPPFFGSAWDGHDGHIPNFPRSSMEPPLDPATRWPGSPMQPIKANFSASLSGSGGLTATISAATPPPDFSLEEVKRRILHGVPVLKTG